MVMHAIKKEPTQLRKELVGGPWVQVIEDDLELLLPTSSVSPTQFADLVAYTEGDPGLPLPPCYLLDIICVLLFHYFMEILSCQYEPLPHFTDCFRERTTCRCTVNNECGERCIVVKVVVKECQCARDRIPRCRKVIAPDYRTYH